MYQLSTHEAIDQIAASDWNRLVDADTPFLRHEFLSAMERHGCVGEALGWIPRHLALRDPSGTLVAAAPCYLKFNSYGEFVFDWSWAAAYRRNGLDYYPKLVVGSPYTPATGPRLLTAAGPRRDEYARALAEGAVRVAEGSGVSSLHWLFTTATETDLLAAQGLLRRRGCQFQWTNHGYGTFDDLLTAFTAEKRKKIKRERRRVWESGLRLQRLRGDQVGEAEWAAFHRLYCDTFQRHGGLATLTLPFFQEIATTMGPNLLLILAEQGQTIVAAAFGLLGERSLFGRHWGASADFHSLHFEACYYQGLEYCIAAGLSHFEPGAQGEHKVSRGFLPTPTWSAHWIANPGFRAGIRRFLREEERAMNDYHEEMYSHSPYNSQAPVRALTAPYHGMAA
jgi:uncharacterized protein